MKLPVAILSDGGGSYPTLDILYASSVHELTHAQLGLAESSNINVNISVNEIDMGIEPDGYLVKYRMFASNGTTPDGDEQDLWPGSTTRKLIFYKSPITNIVCENNTVTFTAEGHDYVVGDYVTIKNTYTRFDGSKKKVLSVTANTFSLDATNMTPLTSRSTTGTVSQDIIITGLNSGRYYDFKIIPYKGNPSLESNWGPAEIYSKYKTSYYSPIARDKISPASLANQSSGKSYLEILNDTQGVTSLLYKDFDSVLLPEMAYDGPYIAATQRIAHYAFGTTIYFDTEMNSRGRNAAGLGFFVSNNGGTGYFIQLSTDANASDSNKKPFRIIKVDGSEQKTLKDSQITRDSTFAGVYPGTIYNIDVKVR